MSTERGDPREDLLARYAPELDDVELELSGSIASLVLHGDQPMGPHHARDVLANVLGLQPNELRNVSEKSALGALEKLHSLVRRLGQAAGTDELTGAMRRGAGMQALNREIARARRGTGRLVLAVVDVDGLKKVNDTDGHLAGDRLLSAVVTALSEQLRAYDLVIRYGGDEFVVVFNDADIRDARGRFRQVAHELARRTKGQSVSVGLASLRPGDDIERLIRRADASLYAGRRRRRGLRAQKGQPASELTHRRRTPRTQEAGLA